MLICLGMFWEFYHVFYWKDVALVGIFCQDLSESFIKYEGSNLGLPFKIYQPFFLLPNGYMYNKSLAALI